MKSILFLGAAHFQVAPIKYAYKSGYKIYTCDNKKENPGHKFANKSFNISSIDYEAIIEKIKPYKIDAVISYASDISAFSAAKIAEFFDLKSNCSDTISLLTNKIKFREFLSKKGIQKQLYFKIKNNHLSELCSIIKKYKEKMWVLKPCDSSGSKGVSLINKGSKLKELKNLIKKTLNHSKSKILIIEEFVEKKGNQVCGDGYFKKGKIEFIFFGDGWSYHNKPEANFTPYAESFPSSHKSSDLEKLKNHIENILIKAGFNEGPFNHDSLIMKDGTPFVIEIGPRNGGNYIPDAINHLTGFDFAAYTVEQSLGNNINFCHEQPPKDKFVINLMLHWHNYCKFNNIDFNKNFEKKILEMNLYVTKGDAVERFRDSQNYFGNIIFTTNTKQDYIHYLNDIKNAYELKE